MSKTKDRALEREMAILQFMEAMVQKKGYAPTVREICQAVGIRSTSTVHKDLKSLADKGLLIKDPAKPRALVLASQIKGKEGNGLAAAPSVAHHFPHTSLTQADETSDFNTGGNKGVYNTESRDAKVVAQPSKRPLENNIEDMAIESVPIPIVGTVAAGMPILAEENIDGAFPMPSKYISGTNFMLKVKGDSMINAGIYDGDLILVQKQSVAHNGDIVVAMVEGLDYEATVKTFYKEDGHIRLQPENDFMNPIIVPDATILGKVKGVFRYYK